MFGPYLSKSFNHAMTAIAVASRYLSLLFSSDEKKVTILLIVPSSACYCARKSAYGCALSVWLRL